MKTLVIIPAILAMTLICNANEGGEYDEKAEMKQTAKEYRKCAEENKSAALEECERNGSEIIKAAASKAVASRQKIGGIEEQLAAAYEAGDKKLVQKLHEQKNEAELEYEFTEKEKKAAYVMNGIEELLKEIPKSSEASELKTKTETELKAYLENAKKLSELQKQQMQFEKGMESLDLKIELIKKREELKRLEEESSQN